MGIKNLKNLILIFTLSILSIVFSSTLLNAQKKVSEQEKSGGPLRIGVSGDPKSLDARYHGNGTVDNNGQQQIYERLVEYSNETAGKFVPLLATSWRQLDPLTWLVDIRKGVKFHNGKELTAEDVKKNIDYKVYSREFQKEKGWRTPRVRPYVEPVKEVEVVDRFTIKVILKYPLGPFVGWILNWGTNGVIDPDIVQKWGKEASIHAVGTGPFKFVEWVSGDHYTYERFEEYWGKKAYLNKVIFRIIPDPQTRLIALQKEEIDLAELPLTAITTIKKDPNLTYWAAPGAIRREGVLFFNLRRWPMNSLKFRQAVVMGGNWVDLTKKAFPEGAVIINQTFLRGSWAQNREIGKLLPTYNPQKAKQLIKEVENEGKRPLPEIDALTHDREPGFAGILLMAAEELKLVGIKLKVRALPTQVASDTYRRNPQCPWDLVLSRFGSPIIDPTIAMKEPYSKSGSAGDGKNIAGYHNPRYDELHLKGLASGDQKERIKIYQEMEKILLEDLPISPIFQLPTIYGANKKVHDFVSHDSGYLFIATPWNNIWLEKKVR